MLPYLLLLGFVMFWIFLEKKSLNRNAFWVPFFTLVLFASIRSYLVGTDTGAYTSDFRNKLDIQYFIFSENLEYGYQVIKYIILYLTHNYFWLLFVSSIIVVGSYLYIFKKKSEDYFLSIFIFLTFGFYTFYFNGLRQGLSMALAVWATPYLIDKKIKKFTLIILLASLFHKSALIMFVFYFLIHLKFKLEYKIIGVFLGSLMLSGATVQYLASTNEKYTSYTEVSEDAGGYLTLGFYFMIGLFIYILMKLYKITNKDFYILLQLYIYGIVFLIPVAMLGANPSGPQRLLFYFVWPVALLLPIVFNRINNKLINYIFILFSVIYFYMITSKFSHLTPYIVNESFRIF